MEKSSCLKISLVVLTLVVGLTVLSGSVGQVYAYPHHYYSCSHNWWWGCNYSYYYPYNYYYYPYSSYYYPYYGYYGYSYPYSYGYGSYGYNQQYQLTLNTNPSSISNVVSGGGQYGREVQLLLPQVRIRFRSPKTHDTSSHIGRVTIRVQD